MTEPRITGLPIFARPPEPAAGDTRPPGRSVREALAALPLTTTPGPPVPPGVDWALVRAFRLGADGRLHPGSAPSWFRGPWPAGTERPEDRS